MHADTDRTTKRDEDWVQKLVAIVPMVAPAFAFAFVVGYFLAFDISWFPLFSLSEHIVFAIRAFPIAIGASVALLITLTRPTLRNRLTYRIAVTLWILFLILSAILAFRYGHLGLGVSFLLVALGAYFYHSQHGDLGLQKLHFTLRPWIRPARTIDSEKAQAPIPVAPSTDADDDSISVKNILYWAITLTVACLMVGSVSAWAWRDVWLFGKYINFRLPHPPTMFVRIKDEPTIAMGHIIFMGDKNILFYQYGSRTTRLLKRDDIEAMFQCDKQNENIGTISADKGDKEPWSRACFPSFGVAPAQTVPSFD
jgi:hypothetical protein